MAISKKGKRKITVGEDTFYWVYKFLDDDIRLTVMTNEKSHSNLICDFSYIELNKYFRKLVEGDDKYNDLFLIISAGVLTPYVVRQVIDYGLEKGWSPHKKENDFLVKNIEHQLDINFWTESTKEEREKHKIPNLKSKI